ncbi:hypothetical protein [Kineococcus rubinsiae]|uniref:hypothetical protein n=1 Tax=Kineococcus rubinsiae TaxID=2609562 RepID=UPI0014312371|nr:hypothetical protein [Kineococcus rubinsiae]NIZ91996.1 hypothetical protein [Kineococcus rubinsiae]
MNDGDGPDLPEGPTTPDGPTAPEGPAAGDRGHLRDGHLRDVRAGHLRDGHLRDGHLRDGHLRDGHLRDDLLADVGALPTVPDLLATDALLDRLGRHQATEGDLRDTVAGLLDRFARHADPETAGVRGLELPTVEDLPAAPVTSDAPRVLLARRRTIERLGRGTAAACAVLALFGGTAAVAATGGSALPSLPAIAPAASADGQPLSIGGSILTFITGTTEDRAEATLHRLRAQATGGDRGQAVAAAAAARQLAQDLRASGASAVVVARADDFAERIQGALTSGGDVDQALAATAPPQGVAVGPFPAPPTVSTLPYVITEGFRRTAGGAPGIPGVPWAPRSPTAAPTASPGSSTPPAEAPSSSVPVPSPSSTAVVPAPPRSEPAPTRTGGGSSSSSGGSSAGPTSPAPAPSSSSPVVTPPTPTTEAPVPTSEPVPPTSDPVVTPPPLATEPPPTTEPEPTTPTAPPTAVEPSPTDAPPVSSEPTPSEVPVPTEEPPAPSEDVSTTS